jgi:glyoxylase-like metal-dependent hydrolase (beta-lactamase superfamily II)
MKRRAVLGAILVLGVLSMAVRAAQLAPVKPSAAAIEVEKLSGNLFALRAPGSGGTTAVFVMGNGVMLVDTKVSGWGPSMLEKIRTLTDKPVTTIVNTHTHFDHVNGNPEYPGKVEVVTHANTKTYMEQWNPVYGINVGDNPSPFKASGGRGLPTRTFIDRLTLGAGAESVDLYYYGRAHTGGDAYVVFRNARVLHAGDTFPNKNAPIMDRNNGGSGVAYADTLAKAAATPNVDRVITGHSTTMTVAELKEYSDFIREWVSYVQAGKKAGRTLDEVVNAWQIPERFKGYTPVQPGMGNWRANAQVIWDETK